MPEVKTKSGKTIHYSYTKAGKEAAKKRKAAEAKKKKPVSKKKKAAPKKKAYYEGGGVPKTNTTTVNPAYTRWLKRKASVRNQFPNTPDGNRRMMQAIGKMPSKTMPTKKYARGGVTPTKQTTRRAKYKKQAKSLLSKQRAS